VAAEKFGKSRFLAPLGMTIRKKLPLEKLLYENLQQKSLKYEEVQQQERLRRPARPQPLALGGT
jgi:hypothetical protein